MHRGCALPSGERGSNGPSKRPKIPLDVAGVRRPDPALRRRLERLGHEPFLGAPTPVDSGLVHARALRDALHAHPLIPSVHKLGQRRVEHRSASSGRTPTRPHAPRFVHLTTSTATYCCVCHFLLLCYILTQPKVAHKGGAVERMESARNHRASGQSSKLERLFYGGPSIGVLHEEYAKRGRIDERAPVKSSGEIRIGA